MLCKKIFQNSAVWIKTYRIIWRKPELRVLIRFLMRRAKRDAWLFAFGFFSAKTWHPSALVKVSTIFLQAYFSETIQNFQYRTATECPFWPCKKVPKIFRLVDFISFENTTFEKIFRVFFLILRKFTTWTIWNRLKIGINWRKRMSHLRSWKFPLWRLSYNPWLLRKWRKKWENFWVFCEKLFFAKKNVSCEKNCLLTYQFFVFWRTNFLYFDVFWCNWGAWGNFRRTFCYPPLLLVPLGVFPRFLGLF